MGNPRFFLIAALGFILVLMYQAWQQDYGPKPATPPVTNTAPQGFDTNPVTPTSPASNQEELPQLASDSSLAQGPMVSPTAAPSSQPVKTLIHVVTDLFEVKIDPRGGDIVFLALRGYPVALEDPDDPFVLLTRESGETYLAQTGLLSHIKSPSHLDNFQFQSAEYRLAEGQDQLRVPLTWSNPQTGVQVIKTLVFYRGQHVIDIEQQVNNLGQQNWQGRQYRQLVRTPPESSGSMLMAASFNGAAYYSEEDKFEKLDLDEDFVEKPLNKDIPGGWVGMMQHYFISALIPDQQETNNFYTRKIKNTNHYAIGMISAERLVTPGNSTVFNTRFYAGPKEQRVLEELATGLRLSVDYSWLTVIAQPIFWLMEKINNGYQGDSFSIGGVGNWGWTIIILTLLIKLAFFKLSEYGYKSMANMRRVQPKLMSIKERYGSDKQRLQQAMMELYKKEKINPMSGCFPILVQIPVFIALYWVLLESVELRHAPFMLWIQDLSAKDPYFVLPITMGVTMFLQQKLNPAPMDETQQMIMKVLPFIFTIFFLFFPSGLVLYWVVNNILSITQQWVITRRIEGGSR